MRFGPRGPGLGGRSQEGLSWAERSVGRGLTVEAGPSLPAWRRRGSSLGMPRRGGRGGAKSLYETIQISLVKILILVGSYFFLFLEVIFCVRSTDRFKAKIISGTLF